mmetsp:Transcript_42588/g.120808  ORF Transcript_42588/g.120808 Transcript_42588/m.120808 type:complete len:208 (-) Transcript_42588:483-1106(-)
MRAAAYTCTSIWWRNSKVSTGACAPGVSWWDAADDGAGDRGSTGGGRDDERPLQTAGMPTETCTSSSGLWWPDGDVSSCGDGDTTRGDTKDDRPLLWLPLLLRARGAMILLWWLPSVISAGPFSTSRGSTEVILVVKKGHDVVHSHSGSLVRPPTPCCSCCRPSLSPPCPRSPDAPPQPPAADTALAVAARKEGTEEPSALTAAWAE